MKKLLLASAALIVVSAPVLAADMPVKARPMVARLRGTVATRVSTSATAAASFEKSSVGRNRSCVLPLIRRLRFRRRLCASAASRSAATGRPASSSGASRPTSRSPASKRGTTSTTRCSTCRHGTFRPHRAAATALRNRSALCVCAGSEPCADASAGRSCRRRWSILTAGFAYGHVNSALALPTDERRAHRRNQFRQQSPLRLHRRHSAPRPRLPELQRQDRVSLPRSRQQHLRFPDRHHRLLMGSAGGRPYRARRPRTTSGTGAIRWRRGASARARASRRRWYRSN